MKTPKKTLNVEVAEWLIHHRWRDSLEIDVKQRMPSFVDDAVMAAVYIVAGTSGDGRVSLSPKLVFKCLMLPEISVSTVKTVEYGHEMSDRHAQRLAQTVRYALRGIASRIQSHDLLLLTEDQKESIQMERDFVRAYYQRLDSPLFSPRLSPVPGHILDIKLSGDYLGYAEALRAFRINS